LRQIDFVNSASIAMTASGHKADIPERSLNVRYWHKADMLLTAIDVRFFGG
jgi:hypothetical protein